VSHEFVERGMRSSLTPGAKEEKLRQDAPSGSMGKTRERSAGRGGRRAIHSLTASRCCGSARPVPLDGP
jgi:hypothetical protein